MSLLSEFEAIVQKKDDIVFATATELHSVMRTPAQRGGGSPVDTGNLRASWTPIKKTKDGYKFTNTAIYASIALGGVRVVNGKKYGSEQLPEGIDPLIERYNGILQKRLKGIK